MKICSDAGPPGRRLSPVNAARREDRPITIRQLSARCGLLGLLGCLLLALPAPAAVFSPERFVLDNGLEVVVVSDHRVPVVAHMVWYRVGAADEPPGKSGLAHFLEHLMFKGTARFAPGEASTLIARIGGNENAFTGHDYTAYYQIVASDRLATVMEIEADRMVNLRLREADLLAERDVVLEERRSTTDNSDAARLAEQARAALYLAYPYRDPVIGWEHDIRRLTRDDVLAFYRRWYAPDNAILVVAGDVTADRARKLAEEIYGPLPRRGAAARQRVEEPPHAAGRRVRMTSSQIRQPEWSRRYLAPSYHHGATEHVYALQVLAEILGSGTTSRFHQSLVIRQNLAVSADVWFNPVRLGPATFGFFARPAEGRDIDDVEGAVDAEIERLLRDGVTSAERDSAVRRMLRGAIFARDSVTQPGHIVGRALATGQRVEDIEAWPERIAMVTVAGIDAAARAVFQERQAVTTVLLPETID